jgi:hypothetical protein
MTAQHTETLIIGAGQVGHGDRPSGVLNRHGLRQEPWTVCHEHAVPDEIRWRAVLESTDGPIEHATIVCSRRHWFLLPVAALARF